MMVFYSSDLAIIVQHADGDTQIDPNTYSPAKYLSAPNGVVFPLNSDDVETLPTDVAVLRTCAVKTARIYRDKQQGGTFSFNGAQFDADPGSREKISAASLLATQATMMAQPFTIDWTDAAGVDHALDGPAMMQMGQAAAVHVQTEHGYYKYHKGLINAATTAAEVLAITEAFVW